RLYAAGATLNSSGQVTPAPPPPSRIKRPVFLAVMAESGAADAALKNGKPELVGEAWGAGVAKAVVEARTWAAVAAGQLHLLPRAESLPALAPVIRAVKRITGLPVSLTVSSELAPEALKPLAGAADELLIFNFGRRPETGDRMMAELSEPAAR